MRRLLLLLLTPLVNSASCVWLLRRVRMACLVFGGLVADGPPFAVLRP